MMLRFHCLGKFSVRSADHVGACGIDDERWKGVVGLSSALFCDRRLFGVCPLLLGPAGGLYAQQRHLHLHRSRRLRGRSDRQVYCSKIPWGHANSWGHRGAGFANQRTIPPMGGLDLHLRRRTGRSRKQLDLLLQANRGLPQGPHGPIRHGYHRSPFARQQPLAPNPGRVRFSALAKPQHLAARPPQFARQRRIPHV